MFELPESFLNMLFFSWIMIYFSVPLCPTYLTYLNWRENNYLMWWMLLRLANAALSLIIILII